MEEAARKVAARLREDSYIAYFAGGCVRDMVRGLAPKDYDIATDARPEVVQKLFQRTYAVGAHFGVIIVLENDFQFEVATFRSDEAYIDGRHPTAVHFSSPQSQGEWHALVHLHRASPSQVRGSATEKSAPVHHEFVLH